jgi:hypothetical protein
MMLMMMMTLRESTRRAEVMLGVKNVLDLSSRQRPTVALCSTRVVAPRQRRVRVVLECAGQTALAPCSTRVLTTPASHRVQ